MDPIVIVGSGLAGYTLAREFRKLDQQTPLQIVTSDDGTYYSKPQLSSAFTHHKTADALAGATATKMSEQLKAEIFTFATATKIDADNKILYLQDKPLPYFNLILAQGAEVIKIAIDGNATKEIQTVNNLTDYQQFREYLKNKRRIIILGAGLVGCEFANDLLHGDFQIEMVALAKTPLDILLPPELGKTFQKAMEEKGVEWHLECSIKTIDYNNSELLVMLSDRTQLVADAILSAIGLRPVVSLAKTANLEVNRGIVVDKYLQTSVNSIFALGDCAEVAGYVMFYVAPLVTSARALAATLAGVKTAVSYPPMPVILKTPFCPVVVNPPPFSLKGHWEITGEYPDKKALFFDIENKMRGFALTGKMVLEKMNLVKELPILF